MAFHFTPASVISCGCDLTALISTTISSAVTGITSEFNSDTDTTNESINNKPLISEKCIKYINYIPSIFIDFTAPKCLMVIKTIFHVNFAFFEIYIQ